MLLSPQQQNRAVGKVPICRTRFSFAPDKEVRNPGTVLRPPFSWSTLAARLVSVYRIGRE